MSRRIDISDLSPAYQEQVRRQLARAKTVRVANVEFPLNGREPRAKYRSIKTQVDGIDFDSKFEARRYLELKAMQESGLIEQLEVHKPYALHVRSKQSGELLRIGSYEADFTYRRDGRRYVEDTKSVATRKLPLYRWKRHHFETEYGLSITEVCSRQHRKRQ